MRTIYRVDHSGVIGIIEGPETIDPARPLAEQLRVQIGVDEAGRRLDPEDFEARVRLVVLELQNFIRDELGIEK